GCVATLAAQTPPTSSAQRSSSDSKDLIVTGCLERGADGMFTLANAREEAKSEASAATGTTGTSSTATSGTSSSTPSHNYRLEGGTDLEKHVGHKIQVTGMLKEGASSPGAAAGTSTAGTSGAASGKADAKQLDVKSVKMIAASCS